MTTQEVRRKLAASLSADVVGYSKPIGAVDWNEKSTPEEIVLDSLGSFMFDYFPISTPDN